jgi:hypothetical protein
LPASTIPAALVSKDARIMSLRSPPVISTLFFSGRQGRSTRMSGYFSTSGFYGIYLAMITTKHDILYYLIPNPTGIL